MSLFSNIIKTRIVQILDKLDNSTFYKNFNNCICKMCGRRNVTINHLCEFLFPYVAFVGLQVLTFICFYYIFYIAKADTFPLYMIIVFIIGSITGVISLIGYIALFVWALVWIKEKLSDSIGQIEIARQR